MSKRISTNRKLASASDIEKTTHGTVSAAKPVNEIETQRYEDTKAKPEADFVSVPLASSCLCVSTLLSARFAPLYPSCAGAC
jgi:hypothetical protein